MKEPRMLIHSWYRVSIFEYVFRSVHKGLNGKRAATKALNSIRRLYIGPARNYDVFRYKHSLDWPL